MATITKEDNAHLGAGSYLLLAGVLAGLGTWASYVNWQYFNHGSQALEADEAVRAITAAAAVMFIVAEMAAFAVAALLPKQRLASLRNKLFAFGVAMILFEVATIVLVQTGMNKAADYQAKAIDTTAELMQTSIKSAQATTAELREGAKRQVQSKFVEARADGNAALVKSLEADQMALAKAGEIHQLLAARKPTSTELLGQDGAMYYAVGRGLLVVMAGLVFFSGAGYMVRMFNLRRGAGGQQQQLGNDTSNVVELDKVRNRNTLMSASAATAALLAAMSATAPTPAEAAQRQYQADYSAWQKGQKPADVSNILQAQPKAQPQPQAKEKATKKPRAPRTMKEKAPPAQAGAKIDTGVGELDGYRYRRVVAGVKAGTIRPSERGIQAAEGGGGPVVRRYLAQMLADGVIETAPSGVGYQRAKQSQQTSTGAKK